MKFIRAVSKAVDGIVLALSSGRNIRIQLAFVFYVTAAGVVTRCSAWEWAVLLLCFGAVIFGELLNSAIERLSDEVNDRFSTNIRDAKDMAAGAVLVAAVVSCAAGGIIFFNREKVGRLFEFARGNAGVAAALALAVVPFAIWVGGADKDKKDKEEKRWR